MSFVSSPVTYPLSSSPSQPLETLKRPNESSEDNPKPKKRLFGRTLLDPIEPLRSINGNASRATEAGAGGVKVALRTEASNARTRSPERPIAHEDVSTTSAPKASTWIEPPFSSTITPDDEPGAGSTVVRTSKGRKYVLRERVAKPSLTYEQIVAERSHTDAGRATKSFYGIDVHNLLEEAKAINRQCEVQEAEAAEAPVQPSVETGKIKRRDRMMWAEKYRAKKFTDLVGDERTHRSVLRWLKGWDSIVFPGTGKSGGKSKVFDEDEKQHRKIMLLTGPPGLGKTTLAHVCAKQAGYEVVEINASDDRSSNVVKGRIWDCVGTENVRGVATKLGDKTVRKAGRPVCVVVDEVDGVTGGSGGSGEGGFMKALIDLIMLDQKNSNRFTGATSGQKQKGDRFRLLRPMILICNDVYHPSLRPLRASNLAEIIHIRKPPLDKIVARLKHVFDKESVPADTDGVRRLCEATWGISSRREDRHSSNSGEGDMRAVLVVGEWAAGKLRASSLSSTTLRLTRQWLEKNMLADLTITSSSSASSRGLGRGGTKEAADRVFLDNAGFPKSATAPNAASKTSAATALPGSATEATKARALELLRSVVDTAGDTDRIVMDVFTAYPSKAFHDDTLLSKPNAAADWMSFHDTLSSKIHGPSQSYELAPYLNTSVLAFHTLFASAKSSLMAKTGFDETEADVEDMNPFAGPRADFIAREAQRESHAQLSSLQSTLSLPLTRSFRSPEHLATDLVPYLYRMLSPSVTPVLVGGSGMAKTASVRRDCEKDMVTRSVSAMGAAGISLERMKVDDERIGSGGFVYRMDPPIDTLATFETAPKNPETAVPTRFAVRQVLAQEHTKWRAEEEAKARQARFEAGKGSGSHGSGPVEARGPRRDIKSKESGNLNGKTVTIKKDFFGRAIKVEETSTGNNAKENQKGTGKAKTWVTYHEGFSNAVRKPISLAELMAGL